MSKFFVALLYAGAVCSAVPAASTILIYATPGAIQPAENVLFQAAPPSGVNAFGITNQTSTAVTFTGIEALATPSSGQARIEAADGGLSQLSFALAPGKAFSQVEFNISGSGATATSVLLNFTDQFGAVFSGSYAIGNGQNIFSANAIDSQLITNVSFMLNGNVQDVRQVRLGGVTSLPGTGDPNAVPEPASWAMLMAGFGLIGATMRRRKSANVVTS
jgi:hypothetical protein